MYMNYDPNNQKKIVWVFKLFFAQLNKNSFKFQRNNGSCSRFFKVLSDKKFKPET